MLRKKQLDFRSDNFQSGTVPNPCLSTEPSSGCKLCFTVVPKQLSLFIVIQSTIGTMSPIRMVGTVSIGHRVIVIHFEFDVKGERTIVEQSVIQLNVRVIDCGVIVKCKVHRRRPHLL